jgi:hypothetical protein
VPTMIVRPAANTWTRLLSIALSLAVLLLAVGPWAVLADVALSDGDAATPAVSDPLDFGQVCLNTTPSKSVTLAISRLSSGATVYADSATLTWTRIFDPTALSATVPGSSALPSNWGALSFGTLGAVTSSSVTLAATLTAAEGAFSTTIDYVATGARSTSSPTTPLQRSTSIVVSGTVISCDDDPPILSLPAGIQAEATSASGAIVVFSASASDASPTNPAVNCSPASGSTFALGSTTVNCSATDDAGNIANGTFNVTVVDTTAPSLSGTPADISLEATNGTGEVVNFTDPTAFDLVDGSVNVVCLPASGSTFALGPTTVTCSATDDAFNTGQSQFTVTVSDTTAPTLVLPADQNVEATSASGAAVSYTATASDLVDGAVSVDCLPASGSTFPLGETTVNCSATDAASNQATGSFKIVVQDTTAPIVIAPANVIAEATGPSGAAVTYSGASASDLVDGAVAVDCLPASGSTFALGATTVACSATDLAGNIGSADFTVTVQDTTGPALSLPANIAVAGTGVSGASVSYAASATDLVDGSVGIVCTPPSGSTFGFGTTTVNCSASDGSGNESIGSFTIHVGYQLNGFYQPVDMDTALTPHVWNTVKAGSTVPLKWEVFAGSYEFTSTSIVSTLAKQVTCNFGPEDTIEVVATGGTSLRYDTTSGQFIFNWQTPKLVGKCYDVTVTLNDGSLLTAHFKLK